MKKIIFLFGVSLSLLSCQFSETMVINEDGSGRMALSVDLSEMMAFGGEMSQDSSFVKQDTIIAFRDILEEKKDSIAQLPMAEQDRLKAMSKYNLKIDTDPEINKMVVDMFVDFTSVSEANELMKGFEQTAEFIPGMKNDPDAEESDPQPEILGVTYSFKKSVFKRDAFIKDNERHKAQVDSMQQAEAFMSGMNYTLKYTFPKRIKKTSTSDAKVSADGKTVTLERSFVDYFKNPDLLDLTVELEK